MTETVDEMRRRAQALLDRTHYEAEAGVERIADARMCARHVLDLAERLEGAMAREEIALADVERLRDMWFLAEHGQAFPH